MLILKRERNLIAQHPAKPNSQIAIPQLSQVTQHRAIALLTCGRVPYKPFSEKLRSLPVLLAIPAPCFVTSSVVELETSNVKTSLVPLMSRTPDSTSVDREEK